MKKLFTIHAKRRHQGVWKHHTFTLSRTTLTDELVAAGWVRA